MKVNILGTEYLIDESRENLAGGINPVSKIIYAYKSKDRERSCTDNINFRKGLINAFLYESGINEATIFDWTSRNTIDWFALQLPKIVTASKIWRSNPDE